MKRSPIRRKRATPRRRDAPRWSAEDWAVANVALNLRSEGLCEMCGEQLLNRAERAHRIRRRDGGDRLANVLLLHPHCHAWTHAHPRDAMARGLILPTHADPLSVPVLYRGTTLVLLDDEGNRTPV